MLSRAQQARCAVLLAQPKLVLFFVGVMGVAVVFNFVLVIAFVFHPQAHAVWTNWIFAVTTSINLGVLGVRTQVLKRGWLPVSVHDVEKGSLKEWLEAPEAGRAMLERVRLRGWLQWKDVYDLLPPEDAWLRGFQRWTPGKDHIAARGQMRRAAPVVADHVGEQQVKPRARELVRT